MSEFIKAVKSLEKVLIAERRDFHRHPEVGYNEIRTSGIVAKQLNDLGMQVRIGVGKTGVVGLLEGQQPGPNVLLRFDMDALPIQEENDLEYASQNDGVMHACGHDGHVAIGLCVARMLVAQSDKLKGSIKFVFQPAEEGGAGAAAMIKDGVLLNPRPDYVYGMHLWNERPVGWLGATDGNMMAGSCNWQCTVVGNGGHAAAPHHTNDPAVAAAQIVVGLQTVVSRKLPPSESAVVSVTQIHCGDTHNVIPTEASLAGTIRYFSDSAYETMTNSITRIVKDIASAMGCSANVTFNTGYRPVSNDSDAALLVREIAKRTQDVNMVSNDERTAVSEDFSEFMIDIPGCYFFVGSANSGSGLDYPHHHPRFNIDEHSLPIGATIMASIASNYVLE
jgi:amidohydrolase